jgi:hypothetical protein
MRHDGRRTAGAADFFALYSVVNLEPESVDYAMMSSPAT